MPQRPCVQHSCAPHRDTVAGEAAARSPTSNIMDIVPLMAMISEFGRHSFLLSSSTVFMFSIQIASTGPSRMHLHTEPDVTTLERAWECT